MHRMARITSVAVPTAVSAQHVDDATQVIGHSDLEVLFQQAVAIGQLVHDEVTAFDGKLSTKSVIARLPPRLLLELLTNCRVAAFEYPQQTQSTTWVLNRSEAFAVQPLRLGNASSWVQSVPHV